MQIFYWDIIFATPIYQTTVCISTSFQTAWRNTAEWNRTRMSQDDFSKTHFCTKAVKYSSIQNNWNAHPYYVIWFNLCIFVTFSGLCYFKVEPLLVCTVLTTRNPHHRGVIDWDGWLLARCARHGTLSDDMFDTLAGSMLESVKCMCGSDCMRCLFSL